MKIESSVSYYFDPATKAGPYTIDFPISDPMLIGYSMICPNQNALIKIPLNASESAILTYGGQGYWFTKFKYKLKGRQLTFSTVNIVSQTYIVFYYGVPDADALPLEAYKGIVVNASISVSAGAINNAFTTSNTISFPSANNILTAIDHNPITPQGDVSVLAGIQYSFTTQVGQAIYLQLPTNSSFENAPAIRGNGFSKSGLVPIGLPVNLTFTVVSQIIATNTNTTDSEPFAWNYVVYYA